MSEPIFLATPGAAVSKVVRITEDCPYRLMLSFEQTRNGQHDSIAGVGSDSGATISLHVNIKRIGETASLVNGRYDTIGTISRSPISARRLIVGFNRLTQGEYSVEVRALDIYGGLFDVGTRIILGQPGNTNCMSLDSMAKKITPIDKGWTAEQRLEMLNKTLAEATKIIAPGNFELISQGIIGFGMSPYEAQIAGGRFSYHVKADASVWEQGSDPLRVIWSQSLKPDRSMIKMTFSNKTQFNSDDAKLFHVNFILGRVSSI